MAKGRKSALIALAVTSITLAGCSTESTQGAAEGAMTGAAVGAVGGMVSALVFGGDIADGAARGAVWGGSTGAVSGGIRGAQQAEANKAAAERQQQAEMKKLEREIGTDTLLGLEALVDCKFPVALAYAETAQANNSKKYALAGHWLEVLTVAEKGPVSDAEAMVPDLVAADHELQSEEAARESLAEALDELGDIRVQYGLARSC